MAKICFEIEVDTDTGEVKAGIDPESGESYGDGEDKSYLQPVGSIREALMQAKEALAGEGMGKGKGEEMEAMQRGYMGKSKVGMKGMM